MIRPTHGSITSVVFDIGWVLVRLDYSRLTALLREHGADVSSMRDVVTRIELEQHETGRLPGKGLVENLARLATRDMDRTALRRSWNDMLELQPAMIGLAQRLAQRYRVHLLSNIGDLHWEHLSHQYQLHELGHGALPSFIAGVMKPNEDIYVQAEERFGLDPLSTVFVDDLDPNVTAACARGWHGIQHRTYEETAAALAGLGVAC